jgi:hypothetical protein
MASRSLAGYGSGECLIRESDMESLPLRLSVQGSVTFTMQTETAIEGIATTRAKYESMMTSNMVDQSSAGVIECRNAHH